MSYSHGYDGWLLLATLLWLTWRVIVNVHRTDLHRETARHDPKTHVTLIEPPSRAPYDWSTQQENP